MKKWKSFPLCLVTLLVIACFTTSCKKDRAVEENAEYVVDVTIVSPDNNATMAVGEAFAVEVDYARNENIIHNIKVEILDMQGNSMQKLVDRHAHVANEFTFKADAVTIDQAGTYIVRALTTDLDTGDGEHGDGEGQEEDKNMVEHTITIQ